MNGAEPARGRSDAPLLSIILVAWNVRDLTIQCLHSIYGAPPPFPIEVVLVDNGSRDGTVEAVREQFPQVVVIANADNAGFARANNQGVARATGRHVLYLNTDTIVGPGTLEACVAELERDATVGAVGCRLMYPDGRVQYEGGRNPYLLRHMLAELFYLNVLFPRSRLLAHHLMGDWDHRGTRDVEALCGAFMMARRQVVDAVGGLPEDIFLYHEDLSFCLRVRKLGLRVRYLGGVETLHLANQTTNRNRLRWYLLEGEHKVLLIREAQGAVAAAVGRAIFGVRSLIRLVMALVALPVPGLRVVKSRYPRVFDVERHALQVVWTVAPGLVRPLLPAAAREGPRAVTPEAPLG